MKEDISLYQWIYEYLLMMIQCGVVSHGESLPPIWDLADKFHVSIRPVQQALAMLESQGWIAMDGKRFRVVARRRAGCTATAPTLWPCTWRGVTWMPSAGRPNGILIPFSCLAGRCCFSTGPAV